MVLDNAVLSASSRFGVLTMVLYVLVAMFQMERDLAWLPGTCNRGLLVADGLVLGSGVHQGLLVLWDGVEGLRVHRDECLAEASDCDLVLSLTHFL